MLNFNLTTMLNQLKTRKKLLIALTLGTLIIILLLLPSKKSKTTTGTLPPQINIPAFNSDVNPQPKADLPKELETRTVAVFEPIKYESKQIQNFFEPVATEFRFTDFPENIKINKIPHLFWTQAPNFLTVNLNNGNFTLDLHEHLTSSSTKIPENDALLFVQNWLKKYSLISDGAQHQVKYFKNVNDEMTAITDSNQAEVYLFSFAPTLNNLPIFTTDSLDEPVSVTINQSGNIMTLYYRLPALFFTQDPRPASSQKPVLSLKQINQQIADKKPVITQVNFSDGRFAPSTANLNNLTYQKITLGYSNDFSLGYFLPVFQLKGAAKLDGGENVEVTSYLPALAE